MMNERELRDAIHSRLEKAEALDPIGYAQAVVCGFDWTPEWASNEMLEDRLAMVEAWLDEIAEAAREP